MKKLGLIAIAILFTGCTDARWDKLANLGNSANIKCYSGNLLIYEGNSSGNFLSEDKSDGYFFREKDTERLLEVSGNCIITYED